MKTRVLITHSWSLNMGDAAILSTMTNMIQKIAPNAEITVLASHPEFTRKILPKMNAKLENWLWPIQKKGETKTLNFLYYPLLLISNFSSAIIYRLTKRRIFIFNKKYSRALSSLFDCDVVISPGGDFISPKYCFVTTFSEFLFSKLLGKKLVIFAQTIGPFKGFLNSRLARIMLKLVDLIIVREQKSADLLEKIGVKNVHITADLVFAFPKPEKEPEKRKTVVICPKKFGPEVDMDKYINHLQELNKRIIREFDCELVYLPTDMHDIELLGEVVSRIGDKVKQIDDILPPQEIIYKISHAEFIISSRMHAIIFGILSNTPFFAIGDSFKFENILNVLCDDCSIDANEMNNESIDRIIEKMREREKLRNTIEQRLPEIRMKALENESILGEKFREWGVKQ